jgi:ATP-dependent helicase HrpB
VSATRLWYHDLLIREDANPSVNIEEAGPVLADALRPQAAGLFRGNAQAATWLARLDFIRRSMPEMSWPECSDQALALLMDEICQGRSTLEEVEAADFVCLLDAGLEPGQRRELASSAPHSLALPGGRQIGLSYEPGKPPILAARVQELFGWTETPRVARGRVRVLLHILGPNDRPVQITDDLASFWKTTYRQVRKDLRGRYPKHAWPEDPLLAQPVRRGRGTS